MKFLFGSLFGILLILVYGAFLLFAAVNGFDTLWAASWWIKLPVMLIVFCVFPWLMPFFSVLGFHEVWGHNWFASVLMVLPWFVICLLWAMRMGLAALFGVFALSKKKGR